MTKPKKTSKSKEATSDPKKTPEKPYVESSIAEEEEQASGQETVSLTTVREMLKVQESMMRSLFDSVISSLNARLDEVVKTVSSIKTSLEYSQQEIDDLKPLQIKLNKAEQTMGQLNDDLKEQQVKAEYLENQSRRNNLRINGIEETEGETWAEAEEKVKQAIKNKLDIDVEIERAHRVERRKNKQRKENDNKPRTIVCKLRDWKQRETILRKARKEKPEGLFVSEDLALATLRKREPLIPKLKAAKEAGKIAYFVLDRLIIKDRSVF